jgi:sugar-specific transcriptional regulator TrmB
MNLAEQLNVLGLNSRQAKIYIALLQLGSASAIEIAKYTKYKHPTVYDVLDALKEKRLVSETLSRGRKLFSAEDPEMFLHFQEERQRTLNSILPSLKDLYLGGSHRPRVHCYDGSEGAAVIRNELLNVKSRKYCYFGAVREMMKLSSPEEDRAYYTERIRRGIWSYAIRIRTQEVDWDYLQPGEKHLRRVRYLPKPLNDNLSGLYIYDSKIAIHSALKENYTIIIESQELHTLMAALWQYIWEIAEEP